MQKVTDHLAETLKKINKPVRDIAKLTRQQTYYENLTKKGIAQKQSYNLKPTSSI